MYKWSEGGDYWACVRSSGLVICSPSRGVLQSQHSSGRVGGQPLATTSRGPRGGEMGRREGWSGGKTCESKCPATQNWIDWPR